MTPAPALQFVFALYLRSWLNIALWPFMAQSGHPAHLRPLTHKKAEPTTPPLFPSYCPEPSYQSDLGVFSNGYSLTQASDP